MICRDCPATIGPRNKTGRCKPCHVRSWQKNPATNAKRIARINEARATPESAARHKAGQERYFASLSPADQERLRECGRRLQRQFRADPAAVQRAYEARMTPEAIRKMSDTKRRTQLAWCPPEKREEYAVIRDKVGAAAAREMIRAEIPGTPEHARRMIANNQDAQRIREERRRAQEY